MKEYVPKKPGTVTRYMVVESPTTMASDLAVRAYEISQGVMIKETCFGIAINGEEKEVDALIHKLREIDPDHIFVKDRGVIPGDPNRCRASLGGARPGFHGIEYETLVLPYVSAGLAVLRDRDAAGIPAPEKPQDKKKKLDVTLLKNLIDAQET
ncbi:MAG TPA: methanogenesis marker 6 protein [Methanoregulaceae archaeon]|nr:methanogenesis marker 6 protein [Methanoregulaceae archaeon]HPD76184.1 methanogenesis marker 6 protein [Methanoregulaceae archaeon]HRY75371.1 methanogenesis marker 6 protein [Methanoregulaceae archaeon]